MVSPPPWKDRREESPLHRERSRMPPPQRLVCQSLGDPIIPWASRSDTINRALQQISQSPFLEEIEGTNLPQRFTRLAFIMYNCKTDLVEHVSHYNQRMTIFSKNETLMYKIFPSNLGPTAMRWFDGLEKDSIRGYDELIRVSRARFITCSRTPKPFLTMSMKESETLRV